MRILYRAVCSCSASLYRGFDEKRVFFEADHNDDAGACLVALLADIWGVPDSTVIYHNLLLSEMPLFLVSPCLYRRLLDAFLACPREVVAEVVNG
ncbi:hypothetical protein OP853_003233 [Salmonella enterica]|nr:hypothetical protein [Salmonella enterica]EKC7220732.1 hypothetical protein [Salmonella enterica]EKJ5690928.1 hypothetical protein [Salmonella enterica]